MLEYPDAYLFPSDNYPEAPFGECSGCGKLFDMNEKLYLVGEKLLCSRCFIDYCEENNLEEEDYGYDYAQYLYEEEENYAY